MLLRFSDDVVQPDYIPSYGQRIYNTLSAETFIGDGTTPVSGLTALTSGGGLTHVGEGTVTTTTAWDDGSNYLFGYIPTGTNVTVTTTNAATRANLLALTLSDTANFQVGKSISATPTSNVASVKASGTSNPGIHGVGGLLGGEVSGSKEVTLGDSSIIWGYFGGTDGQDVNTRYYGNSFIFGTINDGLVYSDDYGGMLLVYADTGTDYVETEGRSAFMSIYAASGASATTFGDGSVTAAYATGSSTNLDANGDGSLIAAYITSAGHVDVDADGSITGGYATGTNSRVEHWGDGGITVGYTSAGGVLENNGNGSAAFGYSTGASANATLSSAANGSLYVGYLTAGETASVTAKNTISIGPGTNAEDNSIRIGGTLPIHIHGSGTPTTPALGHIWIDGTDLKFHDGTTNRTVTVT